MDEFDVIPPSPSPLPQSTHDSESSEEIYMDLPPGIPVTSKEGVVCKLRKFLYGLKQSPRAWFGRFAASMKKFGYRYQRLVGKLIYLSYTRPDIAYAVSVVSQFMHSPSEDHMGVVMRILRYLKVTPGKGLMFCNYGHTDVEGSKKQKVVSRSSAEAEYRGMAQGVCELLWLRRLLRDLGFGPQKPMDLYCDNKAAIAIAHNPVQHDRTKHVEVDRHFVKEKLDAEIISFPFISSEYQLADVLTKAVSTTVFLNSLDKLGMRDIFAPT
ncbi:unnamed protein product [Prunus brigantina]